MNSRETQTSVVGDFLFGAFLGALKGLVLAAVIVVALGVGVVVFNHLAIFFDITARMHNTPSRYLDAAYILAALGFIVGGFDGMAHRG